MNLMEKYVLPVRTIAPNNKFKFTLDLVRYILETPHRGGVLLRNLGEHVRAMKFANKWSDATAGQPLAPMIRTNPLREYFDAHETGRGVWKWLHYFDAYHRHFAKFVNRDVHILEIGVFGGGSLEMWRNYFGPNCHVYGVDIEPVCKTYEQERTKIFIGDQADPSFWKSFRAQVPTLDIVLDDGGHETEQQVVTLEALLPHLRPGGVYLCEDITGVRNPFSSYLNGLISSLNITRQREGYKTTAFQQAIGSVHFYPLVAVIERLDEVRESLDSVRRGSEWALA
jgi:methyltransferase family protein